MRALVLGGSVFVGRRLVAALAACGHDVTVLNRGRSPADLPHGVDRLIADRTDAASMNAALEETQWDAVFDISGFVMAAGGGDIENLLGLLDGRVGHYIYVSSIMAYDQRLLGVLPWTEDMPTNAEGPRSYGGFKAIAEAAMRRRHEDTGFPVTVVRPAAIYGPCNNIFDMETPMFLRLRQQRPVLLPHGGLVAGSYGHVEDLCDAMVALVGRAEAFGEVVNVTTGAVTAARYVQVLAEIVGVEPDVVLVPDDALREFRAPVFGHLFGARHHAILDTTKARCTLGIEPRYDFRAGHEHTYGWFLEQGWDDRSADPLVDPVWQASWDFAAEADVAERLR